VESELGVLLSLGVDLPKGLCVEPRKGLGDSGRLLREGTALTVCFLVGVTGVPEGKVDAEDDGCGGAVPGGTVAGGLEGFARRGPSLSGDERDFNDGVDSFFSVWSEMSEAARVCFTAFFKRGLGALGVESEDEDGRS
jgi:hypothetical protein